VVITDPRMPNIDGMTVVRALRTEQADVDVSVGAGGARLAAWRAFARPSHLIEHVEHFGGDGAIPGQPSDKRGAEELYRRRAKDRREALDDLLTPRADQRRRDLHLVVIGQRCGAG
jgi:hypothetical protein